MLLPPPCRVRELYEKQVTPPSKHLIKFAYGSKVKLTEILSSQPEAAFSLTTHFGELDRILEHATEAIGKAKSDFIKKAGKV